MYHIPTKKRLMLHVASLVPRLSPLRREEPGNEANMQLFFQSGATMSNIPTLPPTTEALWLSWLKRLSSKQEIAGSNPARAFFFFSLTNESTRNPHTHLATDHRNTFNIQWK